MIIVYNDNGVKKGLNFNGKTVGISSRIEPYSKFSNKVFSDISDIATETSENGDILVFIGRHAERPLNDWSISVPLTENGLKQSFDFGYSLKNIIGEYIVGSTGVRRTCETAAHIRNGLIWTLPVSEYYSRDRASYIDTLEGLKSVNTAYSVESDHGFDIVETSTRKVEPLLESYEVLTPKFLIDDSGTPISWINSSTSTRQYFENAIISLLDFVSGCEKNSFFITHDNYIAALLYKISDQTIICNRTGNNDWPYFLTGVGFIVKPNGTIIKSIPTYSKVVTDNPLSGI